MASKYRNITRAVLAAQWAIMPDKLAAICEVLNLRLRGGKLTKSEIAARIGAGPRERAGAMQSGQVAVLNIFGTISHHVGAMSEASGGISSDVIGAAFDKAVSDPSVAAIVLNIDSPGGTVAGTPELAARIFASRGKKPIVAVANSLAASAAYWIGSAASKFVASPSSMVGSIGVLAVHTDDTKAMEKQGLKETVISAGKYKTEGYGPLSDEAKAEMQRRVDGVYSDFIDAVAKHRNAPAARVLSDYGQGRVLNAKDALAAGMADQIATLEQVLSEFGVGIATANGRADAPAFSLEGLSMNPELFGALVRVGMCAITATTAEAENALDRFFAAKGAAKPADVAAQVAALTAHVSAPANTPIANVTKLATQPGAAIGNDRSADILAAVKLAGLENGLELASELIKSNVDLSGALRKINERAAETRQPAGASTLGTGAAEYDKFTTEAKSAILSREFAGKMPEKVYDQASQGYVPFKAVQSSGGLKSLPRLAEECLIREGYNAQAVRSLSPNQICQAAMGVVDPRKYGLRADGGPYNTTGTFTNILMDAANVTLRRSYDEVPTTFQAWMKRAEDITDFKTINRVISGEIGDPRVVPEGGEFDEATMTDGKESYALRVWGQIFYISWQAAVNDQLSAFTAIPRKQGIAMRRKQNKLAYGVLKDNPVLASTGGALFNATAVTTAGGHANLTTGAGAPSVTTLNTLSVAMAKQRGLDPAVSATLGLMPRFILSGATLGIGTIKELLGSTSYVGANVNSAVKNTWYNALEQVVDEELGASAGGSDTAWYLAASSDQIDTLEYAYLDGMDSPQLDSKSDFERLAVKYRIFQPFAVKAIDFRGLQKHAGA